MSHYCDICQTWHSSASCYHPSARLIADLRQQLAQSQERVRVHRDRIIDLEEGLREEIDARDKAEGELSTARIALAEQIEHSAIIERQRDEARVELASLHERLEDNHCYRDGIRIDVEPGSIPDGIECREATIKGLRVKLDELRKQIDSAPWTPAHYWEVYELHQSPHTRLDSLEGNPLKLKPSQPARVKLVVLKEGEGK